VQSRGRVQSRRDPLPSLGAKQEREGSLCAKFAVKRGPSLRYRARTL